jgi:hypothetical protein
MSTSAQLLSDLDRVMLTPIVRILLDHPLAEVDRWQVSPITQGRASPAGVYRIAGSATEQGKTRPWSLVLKEVSASALSAHAGNNSSDDPSKSFYWKREVLLYQSGLFASLPNGIRAPHCYRIDEQPQSARIWMEDVSEDVGAIWPLDHYAHVGRHFGRMNGLYLEQRPLPTWPWLMRSYFTGWLDKPDWPEFRERYPALRLDNALVQRGWSDELFHGFDQIWQDRVAFVDVLARLPQTLHHNDSGRKNLLAHRRPNGEIETVAVDWGSAATGPVGGELACMVMQPVYWFNGVQPEQLNEMDGIVFAGYLQGLRDVGWRGDRALARLGYTASIALRMAFGIFNVEWAARDQSTCQFIEDAIGHPMEEISDVMRSLRKYVLACADEARQLMTLPAITSLQR